MMMKRADILRKAFKDCGILDQDAALLRVVSGLEGLQCTLVPGETPQSIIASPFIWADRSIEVPDRTEAQVVVQPDLPFEPGPSTADGRRTIQLTLKF